MAAFRIRHQYRKCGRADFERAQKDAEPQYLVLSISACSAPIANVGDTFDRSAGSVELYAVGFRGEMWLRGPQGWTQLDSPTNARLTAVRCASAGVCLVGGAEGVLLVGRGNQWSVIDHEFDSETFFCIEEDLGRNFLCADSGKVFELVSQPSYALKPFEVPSSEAVSWIAADSSALMFVATKSVMLFDGRDWVDISPEQE